MVRDPVQWGSLVVIVFGGLSVALMGIAAQVTPPNVGVSDGAPQATKVTPGILDQYVGFYVRGANRVYTIARDGDHLLLHRPERGPGVPALELAAKDERTFVYARGNNWIPLASITFVADASGQIAGLILEFLPAYGTSMVVHMPRIDAAAAATIRDNNAQRARSQTPMPGSDVAVRRLIGGILADNPNYEEMSASYAEIVRKESFITRLIYTKRGPVRSIEFRHVDPTGGDVYEVR